MAQPNERREWLSRLADDIKRVGEGGAGVREPRRPRPVQPIGAGARIEYEDDDS